MSGIHRLFTPAAPWLTLAVVAGIAVRLVQVLRVDFPINDGGLFYIMVEALKENRLRLPDSVEWAQYDLPFAYPPLGFYMTAVIGLITGLTTLDLLRILPLFGSIFVVIAFALLVRTLLNNRVGELVAVTVFAMIPLGYMWSISGGGITRGPAQGFSFLALRFLILHFRSPTSGRLFAATCCCALTVLFNPEVAQWLAFSCAIAALMYVRSKAGITSVACIGFGTLVLSAPWWLLVGTRDGFGLFLDTAGGETALSAVRFLDPDDFGQTPAYALSFAPVLLLALGWSVYRRQLGLALLLAACLVTRNTVFYGWPGLALVIGALSAAVHTYAPVNPLRASALTPAIVAIVAGVVLAFQPLPMVPDSELDAMAWIRTNTADTATFLVFPRPDWYSLDPSGDWFAALTGRIGYGPPMGTEWIGKFDEGARAYVRLSTCQDTFCVEQWAEDQRLEFDYFYVPRVAPLEPGYELVYETQAARIFRAGKRIGGSVEPRRRRTRWTIRERRVEF